MSQFKVFVKICLGLIFVPLMAEAQKETLLLKEGQKQFSVQGFYGDVEIEAHDKPELQIQSSSFFNLKNSVTGISVSFSIPAHAEIRSSNEVSLKILYPKSLNLNFYWYQGNVEIKNTEAPVFVSLQKGTLELEQNKSSMKIFTSQAKLTLKENEGSVFVKTFSSPIEVRGHKNGLVLKPFLSDIKIYNSQGKIKIQGQKAQILIDEFSGVLDLDLNESQLKAQNLNAEIKGKVQKGKIDLDFEKKTRVNLKTDEADVKIRFKDIKGQVYLFSQEGEIRAPKSLEFKKTLYTQVKGSLLGGIYGKIIVKTNKGDIQVKKR